MGQGQKRPSEEGQLGTGVETIPRGPCSVCVGHGPGSSLPLLQELVTFAKYILGKFFALAAVNQKAFVELLFWKNTAVVREMTEGYGSQDGG